MHDISLLLDNDAAWRTYCDEIENYIKAARLQKALKKDPFRDSSKLCKEDSIFTANPQKKHRATTCHSLS